MAKIEYLSERRDDLSGWSRRVRVGEREFHVSVRRGKSVRIPYKPRGKNRGWKWNGCVMENGRCLWAGPVPGSLGCKGLLEEAGVFDVEEAQPETTS